MRISRIFSVSGPPAPERRGVRTESTDAGLAGPRRSVEVPDRWSARAAEALARHGLAQVTLPERLRGVEESDMPAWLWRSVPADLGTTDGESRAEQVFDRFAGELTRQGWKSGYFDSAADARSFFDELRLTMTRQMAMPAPTLLRHVGLYWAYGVAPTAGQGYIVDYRTGLVQRAGAEHVCTGGGWTEDEGRVRPVMANAVVFDGTFSEWQTVPGDAIAEAAAAPEREPRCPSATLNAAAFLDARGGFDADGFAHAARLWTVALDILHGVMAQPTRRRAARLWAMRPLALNLTNLAGLAMARGLAYDSEDGRHTAAAVTALATGTAYATSAEMAEELGCFPLFEANRDAMRRVIRNHYRAAYGDPDSYEGLANPPAALLHCPDRALLTAVRRAWNRAMTFGHAHGFRNAQVSLIAPHAVVDALLDSWSSGVAPVPALIAYRRIGGGGYERRIAEPLVRGLTARGYDRGAIEGAVLRVLGRRTLAGAPAIDHAALHARGFEAEDIAAVEAALCDAPHVAAAFSPAVLGGERWRRLHGATGEDGRSDPLVALGFTRAEIDAADAYCCGSGAVDADSGIAPDDRAAFVVDWPDAAARIRMIAAVQGFVSGEVVSRLPAPRAACDDEVLMAWRLGLKSVLFEGEAPVVAHPAWRPVLHVIGQAADGDDDPAPAASGEGVPVGRFIVYQGGGAGAGKRERVRRAIRSSFADAPGRPHSLRLVSTRDGDEARKTDGGGPHPAAGTSHAAATAVVRGAASSSESDDADAVVQQ